MTNDILDPPDGALRGMRLIFLNAAPRAGKDSAGKAIRKRLPDAEIAKFAAPLKRMTHAMYNLPHDLDPEHFDAVKDEPRDEFYGKSPRQAYIFTSEGIIKPNFGQDFFGKLMLRTLWRRYQAGYRLIAITDSGFAPEAVPAIEAVGQENCLLLRIRGEDRGKTFAGDSRSYIDLSDHGVATIEVANNVEGCQAKFESAVLKVVRGWMRAAP